MPRTFDYVIDSSDDWELPAVWKAHLERVGRTLFSNVWPGCVEFDQTTSDADFANDPAVRPHLKRSAALRLVSMFRKLMAELREEEDLSWTRIFTSARELKATRYLIRTSASDRLCPRIGFGDAAGPKYTVENLAMRSGVTVHKGLEAFIDLGTTNERGDPKILLLIMVDRTQLSRFGRIGGRPEYALAGHSEEIATQWFGNRDAWTYPWTCHAWFDMAVNRGLQRFRDLGCRPVVGSLGVGITDGGITDGGYDQTVWWEYGNALWELVHQFVNGQGEIDAHFWLEDAEGRVYDTIRPRVLLALLNSGQRVSDEQFPKDVCGLTKAGLQSMGFHYHPAPVETQSLLLSLLMHQQSAVWDTMMRRDPTFSYLLHNSATAVSPS